MASEKAVPMMRALSLIYPDDVKCDDYINQYMFGESLLVSAFDSLVYLPEGEWIDYWTGKHLTADRRYLLNTLKTGEALCL